MKELIGKDVLVYYQWDGKEAGSEGVLQAVEGHMVLVAVVRRSHDVNLGGTWSPTMEPSLQWFNTHSSMFFSIEKA